MLELNRPIQWERAILSHSVDPRTLFNEQLGNLNVSLPSRAMQGGFSIFIPSLDLSPLFDKEIDDFSHISKSRRMQYPIPGCRFPVDVSTCLQMDLNRPQVAFDSRSKQFVR